MWKPSGKAFPSTKGLDVRLRKHRPIDLPCCALRIIAAVAESSAGLRFMCEIWVRETRDWLARSYIHVGRFRFSR